VDRGEGATTRKLSGSAPISTPCAPPRQVQPPQVSPATVRTDLPRKHAAKQKPGDDPAFVFVVAKSQARKTRVIDPATYPRILFPDNSLPANSKSFRRRYDDYRDEFCAGVKSESR